MAVRGALNPLPGLICEILNSVGQGNLTFVREKSGNFRNLLLEFVNIVFIHFTVT